MTIEEAAREYIRLRRLRLHLKRERFRLMNLCSGIEPGGHAVEMDHSFSDCLCGYDDYDRRIEGWDRVNSEGITCDEMCPCCALALGAHLSYLRVANRSGAALRRLERKINSATA
jgi:hypothetical protein